MGVSGRSGVSAPKIAGSLCISLRNYRFRTKLACIPLRSTSAKRNPFGRVRLGVPELQLPKDSLEIQVPGDSIWKCVFLRSHIAGGTGYELLGGICGHLTQSHRRGHACGICGDLTRRTGYDVRRASACACFEITHNRVCGLLLCRVCGLLTHRTSTFVTGIGVSMFWRSKITRGTLCYVDRRVHVV